MRTSTDGTFFLASLRESLIFSRFVRTSFFFFFSRLNVGIVIKRSLVRLSSGLLESTFNIRKFEPLLIRVPHDRACIKKDGEELAVCRPILQWLRSRELLPLRRCILAQARALPGHTLSMLNRIHIRWQSACYFSVTSRAFQHFSSEFVPCTSGSQRFTVRTSFTDKISIRRYHVDNWSCKNDVRNLRVPRPLP